MYLHKHLLYLNRFHYKAVIYLNCSFYIVDVLNQKEKIIQF